MGRSKELTLEERKVLAARFAGATPTQAAITAGKKGRNARNFGCEVMKRPRVQKALKQLMNKAGITDAQLVQKLKEGLDATKVISCTVILKPGEPAIRERDADSKSVDFIDVPDFPTRHKYLETGLKLHGHLDKEDAASDPAQVAPRIAFIVNVNGKAATLEAQPVRNGNN